MSYHAWNGCRGDLLPEEQDPINQLSRYAEALEEELATGREKVAARTRDGLKYEQAFTDATNLLVNHLKSKIEVRDLMNELMASSNAQGRDRPSTVNSMPQG